ncbi:MAG: phosphate ABC transporter ATP-binding protein [Chloroflexia bacterium]
MTFPGEEAFRLEGVRKRYDNREVLRIDQLSIFSGEIFGLVGPSGAGKSTLLRLLNFLEPATTGRILYRGRPLDGRVPPETLRRITTVFQRPLLLTGSVAYNVAFGLRLRGLRNTQPTVEAMLRRVGLLHLARAPVHTLSGGEAQLVALARALVLEPDVLLLDEPTANLDPYHVGLIEEIVCRENRQRGTTVVWVTHHVFQARRVAHRVGLLLGGQLVEVNETRSFFEQPQDPRSAAFVRGEMVY